MISIRFHLKKVTIIPSTALLREFYHKSTGNLFSNGRKFSLSMKIQYFIVSQFNIWMAIESFKIKVTFLGLGMVANWL